MHLCLTVLMGRLHSSYFLLMAKLFQAYPPTSNRAIGKFVNCLSEDS